MHRPHCRFAMCHRLRAPPHKIVSPHSPMLKLSASGFYGLSHKKMRGLAESDPEKYPYLWDVNSDMHKVDIGEGVEVVAKRGDILFYQNFFVHAGSKNANDYPRLACRNTWRWDV